MSGTAAKMAKESLRDSVSPELRYEEFPDGVDITSVSIPINPEFAEIGKKYTFATKNLTFMAAMSSAKVAIGGSSYSPTIKKPLSLIADSFVGHAFGRREIMIATGCSAMTGTAYISHLAELAVIEPVKGMGKGKYRFI